MEQNIAKMVRMCVGLCPTLIETCHRGRIVFQSEYQLRTKAEKKTHFHEVD